HGRSRVPRRHHPGRSTGDLVVGGARLRRPQRLASADPAHRLAVLPAHRQRHRDHRRRRRVRCDGRSPADPEETAALTRRVLSTRERAASILAAAASLFARQGYATTTVDQIAAEAGVSKLMVYRHFNSKRELYTAILDQVRDRLTAIVHPTAAVDPADAGTALRQAIATLAEVFAVARDMP